jgi:hypothetical protein
VRRAALLGAVLLAAAAARAADEPPPALRAALTAAAAAGKPLVLELWGPGCGPCVRMERDVFPDPRVRAALARVHFVRLDGSQGPGEEVHDFVLARGWPTFVRFDGAGRVAHTLYGFVPAERFALWVEAAGAQRPYLDAVRAEIRHQPRRASLQLALARLLRDDGRIPEALAAYAAAERLDPAGRDGAGAEAALERTLIELSVAHKPAALRAVERWLERFPRAARAEAVVDALASFGGAPAVEVEAALRRVYARLRDDGERLGPFVLAALRAGCPRLGVEAATRLIALHPTDFRSRVLLAEALHLAGDRAAALGALDEAAARGTESQRFGLREVRGRLERGRGELPPQLELGAPWLWREPPLAGLPTPERAADDRWRARHAARQQVIDRAKARCAASARDLPDETAYLRLKLGDGRIREVTLLEPGPHAALRACLTAALVGADLPPPIPPGARDREVVRLKFPKTPAPARP